MFDEEPWRFHDLARTVDMIRYACSRYLNAFAPNYIQASGLGASFHRMRRRLTVTGAMETIDGVAKLQVSEELKKEEVRSDFC